MEGLGEEGKKEVMITIGGLHNLDEDSDTIEMVSVGEYYFRNGKHYLMYEDMPDEELGEPVLNTIKLSREEAVLTKRKGVSAQMIFRPGSRSESYYETPFGRLHIGIQTSQINLEESLLKLHAEICYSMDMNEEHVSDSCIVIDVNMRE